MKNKRQILIYGEGDDYCTCLDLLMTNREKSLICMRKVSGQALLIEFSNGEFLVANADNDYCGRDLHDLFVNGAMFKDTKKCEWAMPMFSFSTAVNTLKGACMHDDERWDNLPKALSRLALSPFGFKLSDIELANVRTIAQYHGYNVIYKHGRCYVTRHVSYSRCRVKRITPLSLSIIGASLTDYSGKFTYQGLKLTKE